jgi:hypothetical protein
MTRHCFLRSPDRKRPDVSAYVYNHIAGMDDEMFRFILLHFPDFVERLFIKSIDPDLHPSSIIYLLNDRALTRVLPVEKRDKPQPEPEKFLGKNSHARRPFNLNAAIRQPLFVTLRNEMLFHYQVTALDRSSLNHFH